MHADLLSESEENYVIIEMFENKKEELFTCDYKLGSFKIPCEHRGITAQRKNAKFGFRFKDTLISCK